MNLFYIFCTLNLITTKEVTDSKYYYLALQKCEDRDRYSTHGFWPQYDNGSYPTDCNGSSFNIHNLYPILNQLKENWYSCENNDSSFWHHEWKKHGTCMFSKLDQIDYFNLTLNLFNVVIKNDIQYCPQILNKTSYTQCLLHFDLNYQFVPPT